MHFELIHHWRHLPGTGGFQPIRCFFPRPLSLYGLNQGVYLWQPAHMHLYHSPKKIQLHSPNRNLNPGSDPTLQRCEHLVLELNSGLAGWKQLFEMVLPHQGRHEAQGKALQQASFKVGPNCRATNSLRDRNKPMSSSNKEASRGVFPAQARTLGALQHRFCQKPRTLPGASVEARLVKLDTWAFCGSRATLRGSAFSEIRGLSLLSGVHSSGPAIHVCVPKLGGPFRGPFIRCP